MTEEESQKGDFESSKPTEFELTTKNLVNATTDGYGLCMAIAFENYVLKKGKTVSISIVFPDNDAKNFWTGDNPGSLSRTNSNTGTVFIIGIPFNNYTQQTFNESLKNASLLAQRVKEGNKDGWAIPVRLANGRYERKTLVLDKESGVEDITMKLERVLNLSELEEDDVVNLVQVARLIIGDSLVYEEIKDSEIVSFYETIALGIEIASRPSLSWLEEHKISNADYRRVFNQEANSRIQSALSKLRARDWDYFKRQAEDFRKSVHLPTAIMSPTKEGENPKIVFVDLGDLPPGFHFMALEEIARETRANFVIASRYKPIFGDGEETQKGKGVFDLAIKLIGRDLKAKKGKQEFYEIVEPLIFSDEKFPGSRRFGTVGVASRERFTQLTKDIILALDPELNEVFEGINTIAIVGNPSRGKTTIAEVIERYCNEVSGKEIARRVEEVDRAGYTPDYYLNAYAAHESAKLSLEKKEMALEVFAEIEKNFRDASEKRAKAKISDWTPTAIMSVREIIDKLPDDSISLIDMPGGLPIERDNEGRVTKVERLVPQVTELLSSPNLRGVFIVGKDIEEIGEWYKVIKLVNKQRRQSGNRDLVIVGDAITYVERKRKQTADYPRRRRPNISGEMGGISRGKIYEPNSAIFLMSILISSLGLKKSFQNV